MRPNNTAALFAILAVIGVGSLTMLAVGLELCCEVTRNADGSSAIVWFACVFVLVFELPSTNSSPFLSGNLFGVAFVLSKQIYLLRSQVMGLTFFTVGGAVRAGLDASPPLNLKNYLIFQGVVVLVICSTILFLHGVQRRKVADEEKMQEALLNQGEMHVMLSSS